MSIKNLHIIGERINPGFASSRVLLETCNIKGLQDLAVSQAQKGAEYLTINLGQRAEHDSSFVVELTHAIQAVVDLPLSFDYPNRAVQEVCLKTYDAARAKGRKPIVNSISELRWNMLEVLAIQPARVVLMASERLEDGVGVSNDTAIDVHITTRRMVERALKECAALSIDDLIVDVALGPIACDSTGTIRRAIEAIRLIGADPQLRGIHMVVGLSNLGVMLPKEASDGSRLPVKLESSFLTTAMPLGLDMILGSPGRDYQLLPDDDFVYTGFREAVALEGFDAIMRIQQLYTNG